MVSRDRSRGFRKRNQPVLRECNVKLVVAFGMLNECFNAVKDQRTKTDMLHQAVYSLG
jgi:hypothetical protein